MHGKGVCIKCGKITFQCRCIEGHENVIFDICKDCQKLIDAHNEDKQMTEQTLDRQVE